MAMAHVFLGLGSNEGDRFANLSAAVKRLAQLPQTHVLQMAMIRETQPVGLPEQEPFLNTVVEIDTQLEPKPLLKAIKEVERVMGRCPGGPRWGPRPIDIDILLYEQRQFQEADLTIPHAQMQHRRFVLEPLAELAPKLRYPSTGHTIAEMLAQLPQEP